MSGSFRIVSILLSMLLLFCTIGYDGAVGDRGGMPINTIEIDIQEPGQKAIICWDGDEEILILSTDMKAASPTKVLEIMPLPSAPLIKRANETIFEQFKEMVEERSYQTEDKGGGLGSDRGSNGEPVDVEIIFHDKLGVHNLTVIKALTKEGFANFVAQFLDTNGLASMSFPEAEAVAEAYIQRDINYFVLDVIELTTELKSPEPLMYRFDSEGVYYPMEITSLTGGRSNILLFILTPHSVTKGPYERTEDYFFNRRVVTYQEEKYIDIKTPSSPVNFDLVTHIDISTSVLQTYAQNNRYDVIDNDMMEIYEFFKDQNRIKIGVYEYDGPVEMEGDINIEDYSIQTVELYDEYEVRGDRVLTVIMIPPIILVVVVVALVLYLNKKMTPGT